MITRITYRLGTDPTIRDHKVQGEVSLGTLNTEFFDMVGLDLDMVFIQSWSLEEEVPEPTWTIQDIVKKYQSDPIRSADLGKYHTADENSRIIKPNEVWAIIVTRKAGGFVVTAHHRGKPSLCYFWNNEQGWVKHET